MCLTILRHWEVNGEDWKIQFLKKEMKCGTKVQKNQDFDGKQLLLER